jgi:mono/diheme cytochrome c family protein
MKSKSSNVKFFGAVVALSAAALCGCGGTHRPMTGRALFVTSCNSCHSLTGINTPRQQGGDLLGFRVDRAVLLQFAEEMPVRHPLSHAELDAVVSYILAIQRRS